MSEVVQYQSEEKYALITLKNGKVNAISHEVIDGLNAALNKAEQTKKLLF